MPTKWIRLGNTTVYNPSVQSKVAIQNTNINYTAKLTDTYYDVSSQMMKTDTYDLVVGQANNITYKGSLKLLLTCNTGFKFEAFEVGIYGDNTPLEMPRIEPIEYSFSIASYDSGQNFIVKTMEHVVIPDPEPEPKPTQPKVENDYLLTEQEFIAFRSELYQIVEGESITNESQTATKYTSNQFVTSVKLYPFKIPLEQLGDAVSIKVKKTTMTAKATTIKNSVIVLDMGIIDIPLTHNNALDFIGVTAELYLPFYTGSINIDPNILIGKKVKIVCEIVVNTGDTTINIYDNSTNTIVDIVKTMIGGDFPLFNAVNQDLLQFTPQQALNPIRQAYIILSRPDYSQNTPKAQRTGNLVGVKGEVTIQDINLITNAYADEKLMIENLISQGVIIK